MSGRPARTRSPESVGRAWSWRRTSAALFLSMSWSGPALAEDPYLVAREAQRAGDPVAEQAACAEVVAAPPTARAARACEARLAWLDERRDPDGGLNGLSRLEAALRGVGDPHRTMSALGDDPRVGPLVRVEARLWLVQRALERDPVEALALSSALWAELGPLDALGGLATARDRAAELHGVALASAGRTDEALAHEAATAPLRSAVPREGAPAVLANRRRARRVRIATAVLGAIGLPALVLATAGWRRAPRPRPWGLVPLGIVAGGSMALAGGAEPSALPALGALTVALALLHLVALGVDRALEGRRGPRRLAATAMGVASLAAAVLVLDATGWLVRLGG